MTTSVSALGRRAVAVAGVAAVGLLGLSPLAVAEEANYGNIKENAQGSLTIHKHLEGDGTVGTVAGAGRQGNKPVAGVQFTAYPIKELDLKKSTDWPKITKLAEAGQIPDDACANPADPKLPGYTFENGMRSGDTDAQGQATISGMPVKAYLVCETKTPTNIVQKAKPFVVTIPLPNADGDGKWIYDVHAHPKNVKVEVKKTIEKQAETAHGVGSKVSFPVTSTLPQLDAKSHYKYFRFTDTLDNRLGEPNVEKVTLDGADLTKGTDYTVTVTNQKVDVDFTRDGLAKLKAAPGKEVKAIFTGKVKSVGDGSIKNKAQLLADTVYADTPPTDPPADPPADPDNPPTTEEVETKWGDLTIKKHDNKSADTGLKGAQFQVYNAVDPYAGNCDGAKKKGAAIQVNGQDTFTTGDDGALQIAGLFVSDSIDGQDRDNQKDATKRCYVLVETKAPAGYVLPDGDAAAKGVTVNAGTTTGFDYTIPNTKHEVPQLPLTGAAGKVLLTLAGAALLMLSVGSFLITRRRERELAEL